MVIPLIRTELPSIELLHELALKYIFERKTMKYTDEAVLQEGIIGWTKLEGKSHDQEVELKRIVNALIADEQGYFYRAKQLLKRWKLHYRQLYSAGLPYINVKYSEA